MNNENTLIVFVFDIVNSKITGSKKEKTSIKNKGTSLNQNKIADKKQNIKKEIFASLLLFKKHISKSLIALKNNKQTFMMAIIL
jgi:hypothetical protein